MNLITELSKNYNNHKIISVQDYFNKCTNCYGELDYDKCHSSYRPCLPNYNKLNPKLNDKNNSINVISKLFNITGNVKFESSKIIEKGKTKPIEIICKLNNNNRNIGYAKKNIGNDYYRSLIGLEITNMLRGNMSFIYNDEYMVTQYQGKDLEDSPEIFSKKEFAYELGVDEAYRNILGFHDTKAANHAYDNNRVLTFDLESILKKYLDIFNSLRIETYPNLHLLNLKSYNEGINDGEKIIKSQIIQNIDNFTKIIRLIEDNHIDYIMSIKKNKFGKPVFFDHVKEFLSK
jgi:hypothetical protein